MLQSPGFGLTVYSVFLGVTTVGHSRSNTNVLYCIQLRRMCGWMSFGALGPVHVTVNCVV